MVLHAAKPVVLIVGGTGNTGRPIVDSLLEYGTFKVAILTRPSSATKPDVQTLKFKGVEIRLGDIAQDSQEQLHSVLGGVDVLISLVHYTAIRDQTNILKAAKDMGIKRVVPCDFSTAGPLGIRDLHDDKLFIRSFIRELGLPYTIIDVGWWMQLSLPYPPSSPASLIKEISYEFYGSGNIKNAVTDLYDIGKFVARIIDDPRTLNQYVFCWGDEITQNEAYEIAERVSPHKFGGLKVHISEAEVLRHVAINKAESMQSNSEIERLKWVHHQYAYSIYFRGDNTIEKAKALGALDAKELYPDFKPRTFEAVAKDFYSTSLPEVVY